MSIPLYWPTIWFDEGTEYQHCIAKMETVMSEVSSTAECDGVSLEIDNHFMDHFGVLDDPAAQLVLTGLEKVPICDVEINYRPLADENAARSFVRFRQLCETLGSMTSLISASLHIYSNNIAVADTVTLTLAASFEVYLVYDFLANTTIRELVSLLQQVPEVRVLSFLLDGMGSYQALSAMHPFLLDFGAEIHCNCDSAILDQPSSHVLARLLELPLDIKLCMVSFNSLVLNLELRDAHYNNVASTD
jgi:hypothetical protein